MRKGFLLSLGALLTSAALARAQAPATPSSAEGPTIADPCPGLTDHAPLLSADDFLATSPAAQAAGEPGFFYASSESLLWWIKDGPLPFPLVTTGNPNDPVPGALGQPGTQPLFGGHGLDYGTFSGLRLTVGGWLDGKSPFGVDASAFLLESRSVGFSASSDALGNPPLYNPLFRPDLGREGSFTISDPLPGLAGSTTIHSETRLWGAEVNAVGAALRQDGLVIDLLAGFRYVDLAENLNMNSALVDPVNLINDAVRDHFGTRNQFYGGQFGARGAMQFGRASVGFVGKVALGASHQAVDINGSTTETGPGALHPGTFLGGTYTQPSNIGRQTQNQFTVLPQAQVKVGYRVLSNLEAFVGYDVLYWNAVVRPGGQIDRSINPTQSLGQPLVGPAAPAAQFNRTDFWAQGISFGLTFRY